MVLAHSLLDGLQAWAKLPLDLSLSDSELAIAIKSYLLACRVEGKSQDTVAGYGRDLAAFHRFLKEENALGPVDKIDRQRVRLFILYLQQGGRQSSTVNKYYRRLHTFFNWMVSENMITNSPMEHTKPPRVDRKLVKPFSQDQVENMLQLFSGDGFLDVRNKAIVCVLLDTGLRLSELANIQLEDINFNNETIRVMGKGHKERVVRIGKSTQKALYLYVLKRNDNYPCLWVSEERTPLNKVGIQTMIKRLCARANVSGVHPGPHTFRHTFATNAIRNGANVFYVQALLGHSTLDMTKRYAAAINSEAAVKAHTIFSPVDVILSGGHKKRTAPTP